MFRQAKPDHESFSRRDFLRGVATTALSSFIPAGVIADTLDPIYPPTDLSYFDKPITPAPSEMRFAYQAITWGGNDAQAIKDISEVGFRGIQLRSNVLKEYGDRPQVLRDLLGERRLEFVALSSGDITAAPDKASDEISRHVRHARFVKDAGGYYLQVLDAARPKDRKPEADDYKRVGRVLTEIGKRTIDFGIPVAYHNHMHSLGEAPEEVDRIMNEADPRYVKLLLDVAHYTQGGGDPVTAITKYKDRHLLFHLKDVESTTPGSRAYRFVELGRGRVKLPEVFAALKKINFRGWLVVELDSVPDPARTPRESAMINKEYIEKKIGMKVQ